VAKSPLRSGAPRDRLPIRVAAGVGVAAVIAAGAWLLRPSDPESTSVSSAHVPVQSARPAAPAPSRSRAEPDDTVSADSLLSGDELKSCVIRQLPDSSLIRPTDFDWLCMTRDPQKGAAAMRSALVEGGGAGTLTPAMDLWSRMRWYAMAGFAVIRASCCERATALELPPLEGCDHLDAILDELGAAVAGNRPYQSSLDRYTKAIKCHARHGGAKRLGQRAVIGGGELAAFQKLLRSREGR
jgi:hypothetical protein